VIGVESDGSTVPVKLLDSQIYVELKKLLDEDSISQYIEMAGVKLEKKMYNLTTIGKGELEEWMLEMDDSVETEKDVFALKLYFLKDILKEDILPPYLKTN